MKIVIQVNDEVRDGRRGVRIQYSCMGIVSLTEKAKVLAVCEAIDAVIAQSPKAETLAFSQSCTRLGNG